MGQVYYFITCLQSFLHCNLLEIRIFILNFNPKMSVLQVRLHSLGRVLNILHMRHWCKTLLKVWGYIQKNVSVHFSVKSFFNDIYNSLSLVCCWLFGSKQKLIILHAFWISFASAFKKSLKLLLGKILVDTLSSHSSGFPVFGKNIISATYLSLTGDIF